MRKSQRPPLNLFLVPSVHKRQFGTANAMSKFYSDKKLARYNAIYPPKRDGCDKEKFVADFNKAWASRRVKHTETLILIYALATMGSYTRIRRLRREDLYPDINCVHVKYETGGYIMPIHKGLMQLLVAYFNNVGDTEQPPLMNFANLVKKVLRTRFGLTYNEVLYMEINKE